MIPRRLDLVLALEQLLHLLTQAGDGSRAILKAGLAAWMHNTLQQAAEEQAGFTCPNE